MSLNKGLFFSSVCVDCWIERIKLYWFETGQKEPTLKDTTIKTNQNVFKFIRIYLIYDFNRLFKNMNCYIHTYVLDPFIAKRIAWTSRLIITIKLIIGLLDSPVIITLTIYRKYIYFLFLSLSILIQFYFPLEQLCKLLCSSEYPLSKLKKKDTGHSKV